MNDDQIELTYQNVCDFLVTHCLLDAFAELDKLVPLTQNWQYSDSLSSLRGNYDLMLNYMADGLADPDRERIYFELLADVYRLLDRVKEQVYVVRSSRFPYILMLDNAVSIDELTSLLRFDYLSEAVDESIEQFGRHEKHGQQLFEYYWLATSFSVDEKKKFEVLVDSGEIAFQDKCLAVSGMTMALLRRFQEDEIVALADACLCNEEQVARRAMVGLLFVLAQYSERMDLFPKIRNRLVALVDDEVVKKKFKTIILQFIRTNQTEQIASTLRNEIIPGMMKVTPNLHKGVNVLPLDEDSANNPLWDEMMEKSGLADKLREFTELQLEGADVYMSTFSQSIHHPFFLNTTSNWFLPFYEHHSEVDKLKKNGFLPFVSSLLGTIQMCDCDRYAFCLSFQQLGDSTRQMLSKAFVLETDAMKEQQKEENLTFKKGSELISNFYIQDLYRFFRKSPHRGDFQNPFHFSQTIHKTWFFKFLNFSAEDVAQIAEFCFSKKLYVPALDMFRTSSNNGEVSFQVYQKMGFCCQSLGHFDEALVYYLKSDLMQSDQKWTIHKIAYCYRTLKDYDNAICFYKKESKLNPDSLSAPEQVAYCYMAQEEYEKALKIFYKLEYNMPKEIKFLRGIVWCLFLLRRDDDAKTYLDKLVNSGKREWVDALNAGHLSLVSKNMKDAFESYKDALKRKDNNFDALLNAFDSDRHVLMDRGVSETDMALILDSLRREWDKNKK